MIRTAYFFNRFMYYISARRTPSPVFQLCRRSHSIFNRIFYAVYLLRHFQRLQCAHAPAAYLGAHPARSAVSQHHDSGLPRAARTDLLRRRPVSHDTAAAIPIVRRSRSRAHRDSRGFAAQAVAAGSRTRTKFLTDFPQFVSAKIFVTYRKSIAFCPCM
mgnify:CR=1 FL=1